jgi:hypothetical protein
MNAGQQTTTQVKFYLRGNLSYTKTVNGNYRNTDHDHKQ